MSRHILMANLQVNNSHFITYWTFDIFLSIIFIILAFILCIFCGTRVARPNEKYFAPTLRKIIYVLQINKQKNNIKINLEV